MTRPAKYNPFNSSDLTLLVREWNLIERPRQQGLDWPLKPWIEEFPEHKDFLTVLKSKNLGLIDRGFLREVVQAQIKKRQLSEAFLACLIWGYGGRGYAQHRTRKIFISPNFQSALETSIMHLQQSNIVGAFKSLIEEGPEGIGCSFGSKFLFFAMPETIEVKPLIVDAHVARAINQLTLTYANSVRITAKKYMELMHNFAQAANHFQIAPEVLEEIMFMEMLRNNLNRSWAVAPKVNLSDAKKLSWVLALATDLHRKGMSVEIERSKPGGEQYECIRISARERLEIEFNLKGSIRQFKPLTTSFTWDSALQMGLLEVSRRLRSEPSPRGRALPDPTSDSFSWLSRALIGKAEMEIDDFNSFFLLSDQQRQEVKLRAVGMSPRDIQNSFVLLKSGVIKGMLIPWKGTVITIDGGQIDIASDCYMPVEMYYGEDAF